MERGAFPRGENLHILRLHQQELPGWGPGDRRVRQGQGRRQAPPVQLLACLRPGQRGAAVLRGVSRRHRRRPAAEAHARQGGGLWLQGHRVHSGPRVFQQGQHRVHGPAWIRLRHDGQGTQKPGVVPGGLGGRHVRAGQEVLHQEAQGLRHHRQGEAVSRGRGRAPFPHILQRRARMQGACGRRGENREAGQAPGETGKQGGRLPRCRRPLFRTCLRLKGQGLPRRQGKDGCRQPRAGAVRLLRHRDLGGQDRGGGPRPLQGTGFLGEALPGGQVLSRQPQPQGMLGRVGLGEDLYRVHCPDSQEQALRIPEEREAEE